MAEEQVLEAPVDTGSEPIVARPARRMGLKITAIVVGALVVLGGAFGGGVLLGSHLNTGGPTQGQFGNGGRGGAGGFGGAPGGGTQNGFGGQQGGSGQGGTGQGGGTGA